MGTSEFPEYDIDAARDRELARYASDVVLIVDANARVLYLSPSAERTMGYRAEEWIGRDGTEVIHPDDLELALGAFGRALDQPGVNEPLEMRVRRVEGGWRWFEVVATNLLDHPAIRGVVLCARDITERIDAHEALRSRDARMHALLRHSSDVVVVVRADGTLGYVSPSAAHVFGYPHSDRSRDPLDVVHPKDRDRLRAALRDQVASSDGPTAIDIRVRHGDGTWRNVELVASNGLADPAIAGIVCNVRDVTDLRVAQDEITRNARRYEALLANLSDLVSVIDADGTMTYLSPATRRLLGRRADDRLGRSIFDYVHPDDAAHTADVMRRALATPGPIPPFDTRVLHEDGTYRTFEVRANNLLDDPAVEGIIVNSRDVTDRVNAERALRTSERLYRTIVETTDEGIWMSDADAVTTFVNQPMAEMLRTTVDSMIGRSSFDFVRPSDVATARRNLERRRAGESSHHDFEIVRQDGSSFWASFSVSPLIDESGLYQGSVAFVTDLTERRATEAALRAAEIEQHQQQAEIAQHRLEAELQQTRRLESLGRLSAGVAHDFNNLLGVILNYAEAAAKQLPSGSRAAADVAQIRQAAEQGAAVTRELLTFGRADTPHAETIEMNELVDGITQLVARSFPPDVKIQTDLASTDCCVVADRTQIEQVLVNLLLNARDAMPDGGLITVGTRLDEGGGATACESDTSFVMVSIADTGMGMDDDVRQRALEPFFTTKQPERGTGLGLSTVHAVVTRAQGRIAIESQVGDGTRVLIWLPVARSPGVTDGR